MSTAVDCPVCANSVPAKYKCPKCASPYCSVACFKIHKESCGKDAVLPQSAVATSSSFTPSNHPISLPSHDKLFRSFGTLPLSPEQLEKISLNENIRLRLQDAHVREMITAILTSQDPMAALDKCSSQSQSLLDFIEEILKVVEV
jgi:hypothetical protein